MFFNYIAKINTMKSLYSITFDTVKNFPIATLINVTVIILAAFTEVIGFGLLLPFLETLLIFFYFLRGVSFFPAIAIAFPFLVLALQRVL